ncbi:MAG: N-6 DNA methylase, partial [candidate division WOR-3 bacterium]|nr:N-6 DNA methylase [candidate division WOR-3 bacterium]
MLKVLAAVEAYLTALRDIRATGSAQPETSLYPALRDLLNDVAKASGLKQLCIMQMANQGAGFPDGGIFSPSQYRRRDESEPLLGQVPEHGVIEAKKVADDAWLTADTRQVSRYWDRYRMVLVTNFRDFLLLGEDANGQPAKLESFRFAESAATFWQQGQHPRKLAQEKGEQFTEFLLYAMLNRAKLADPADVAQALAHYARDARFRVEHKDAPGLLPFRTALEEALGLKFEGEKGDHFFRATLVQTLFYGIFSAWVLWHREKPGRTDEFDWKNAAYYLRLPMLAALFEQVSTASKLRELELIEVLDRAGAVLNRVVRADFFSKFDEGLAVLYFYEPFLKAYDPDLRKALGVWFTPPEIVKYMVARVDHALRTELGIEDGLADERVYVLDPACGTGAYLVEVVDRIAQNVRQNKGEGLIASEVKRALKERVFGFEILPAPFVVSHLQLGLALKRHGATFGPRERAGVYLTNALTGWEPPDGAAKERIHQMDAFPELKAERDAAYDVKREKPILVVLGNPPYNAFAGASPEEEHGMVDAYKEGLVKEWGIKKFNLDDLYVRFFRLAEHRIGDMTGRGVVCYISNHSWVSDPSFVILRRRLLAGFDNFWIENTHGNRKISEYAPDGRTSETVFAIPGFSAGIQQGVAISLWVKNGDNSNPDAHVRFRDDIDDAKATDRRAHLVATLSEPDFDSHYSLANPGPANRYSFRPSRVSRDYESWPLVVSLSDAAQYQGLSEDRRKALIGCDRRALEERMRLYHSRDTRWTELKDAGGPLTSSYVDFPAEEVRANVLALSDYDPDNLLRYWLRPFDTQYCYYSAVRPLWRRHRPGFHAQLAVTDQFITTRFKQAQSPEGAPLGYVRGLCDYHYLTPNVTAFPVVALEVGQADYRKAHPGQLTSLESSCPRANLSDAARVYLKSLGVPVLNCEADASGLVWMHVLAMGYSRAYIEENADGMSQDWPRIPLPDKRVLLEASAALGREVASLLDTESELRGVTTGRIRPELAAIARPSKDGGGSLDPDADFAVTVGWGHAGKEGVTMPGKGDARERDYLPDEKKAIVEAAERVGLSQKEAFARLGKTTFDIYLNGAAFWKNVPKGVWEYYIGGYQVVKKWLSYREEKLLGRPLKSDEVEHVMNTCRRLAAILLLQ